MFVVLVMNPLSVVMGMPTINGQAMPSRDAEYSNDQHMKTYEEAKEKFNEDVVDKFWRDELCKSLFFRFFFENLIQARTPFRSRPTLVSAGVLARHGSVLSVGRLPAKVSWGAYRERGMERVRTVEPNRKSDGKLWRHAQN